MSLLSAAQLLVAFVGDRVARIEQVPPIPGQTPALVSVRIVFQSGRTLTFPVYPDRGFVFDDEPHQPTVQTNAAPADLVGIISDTGIAAYPSEAAFLNEWEQNPTTGAWRRR